MMTLFDWDLLETVEEKLETKEWDLLYVCIIGQAFQDRCDFVYTPSVL
jgi:hypothetical protein